MFKRMAACGILALAGMAALFAPALAAGPRYAREFTPLRDGADGKRIGALAPGAAVEVLGQSGDATHVAVHGWIGAEEAILYLSPRRHIALVNGFTGHATEGAHQSAGGTTYHAVTIEGWVASASLVDNVATVWKEASALYASKCSACHGLPAIKSHSADQWATILPTQLLYAGLDTKGAALVTAYIETQAGR